MSDLPAQAGPARERRPVRDDDLGGSTRPQGRLDLQTPEAPTSGVRPVCERFDVACEYTLPSAAVEILAEVVCAAWATRGASTEAA